MSESWLEQLQKAWCYVEDEKDVKPLDKEVKQCNCTSFTNRGRVVTCNCDVQEPSLKLTDPPIEDSNQDCWTQVTPNKDEGLK